MHAGDKPYVVSPTGQVELATRGLALDAVNGIVSQLLPPDMQQALDEFGAVQHELAALAEFPGEHFTIVAARGGDDLWVEIRRRRIPEDDRIPDDFFPPPDVVASAQPYPVYAAAASPSLAPPAEPLPDSLELEPPPQPHVAIAPQAAPELESPPAAPLSLVLESRATLERQIDDVVTLPPPAPPPLISPFVPVAAAPQEPAVVAEPEPIIVPEPIAA